MRKSFIKEGLAVGIICLLMLVSFPTVASNEIEFPKEEGPYFV